MRQSVSYLVLGVAIGVLAGCGGSGGGSSGGANGLGAGISPSVVEDVVLDETVLDEGETPILGDEEETTPPEEQLADLGDKLEDLLIDDENPFADARVSDDLPIVLAAANPEPVTSALTLMGMGALGLAAGRRRRA